MITIDIEDIVSFSPSTGISVHREALNADPETLYRSIQLAFDHIDNPLLIEATCAGAGPLADLGRVSFEEYLKASEGAYAKVERVALIEDRVCERLNPPAFVRDASDSWADDAAGLVLAQGTGYVYVLSNPSMPGIVKIGHSIYGGKHRANALYKNITGVPEPFRLEFEVFTQDYALIEERAHEALASARVNASREFFRCDVREAVLAVLKAVSAASRDRASRDGASRVARQNGEGGDT